MAARETFESEVPFCAPYHCEIFSKREPRDGCRGAAGGEVRCAVCESVSSAVEPHPLLEDLLRLSQRTGPTTRCGQCAERNAEEVAVANCVDCSTALCRECVNVSDEQSSPQRARAHLGRPELTPDDLSLPHKVRVQLILDLQG